MEPDARCRATNPTSVQETDSLPTIGGPSTPVEPGEDTEPDAEGEELSKKNKKKQQNKSKKKSKLDAQATSLMGVFKSS
jgi:hypothetical protein